MRSRELIRQIQASMSLLIESSDELRDLDQVLGDGDLGITISAGARAVIDALDAMPTEPELLELMRARRDEVAPGLTDL